VDLQTDDVELWVRIGLAILVIVAAWVLRRIIRRSIRRFSERHDLARKDPGAETRFKMISRLIGVALYFLAFALAFWLINVDAFTTVATWMFASAGLLGITLAFAGQSVAANLVSGILIAFVQPVRLGDSIDIDDENGTVQSISLFYTTIRVWDNRHLLIPNNLLSDRIIHDYTMVDPKMIAVVDLRLDYGGDVQAVRSLLLKAASEHPSFLTEPEPSIHVEKVNDSGISVRLKAWAPSKDEASALAAHVRETVTSQLQEAGATVGVTSIQILSGITEVDPPPPTDPEPRWN
jgi:small-conductance mechanosensitive channel